MTKKNQHSATKQGIIIGISCAIISTILYNIGALGWIENEIWDRNVNLWAKPSSASDQICSIMVDQNSLDSAEDIMGITWKWPRPIYAAFLSFCKRGGAKVVAFDMIFTEQSQTMGDDAAFGKSLASTIPSVVAIPLSMTEGSTNWLKSVPANYSAANKLFQTSPLLYQNLSTPYASFPIPEVATNATILANVLEDPDKDAIFRRIGIGRIFDNRFIPNLGLAAYLAANPKTKISSTPNSFKVGNHNIPIDSEGKAILRFCGKSQTHLTLNAGAVLQSELRIQEGKKPTIDPTILKGRYVFFGLSAPGLMDLKPTPVGKTYPGVEIHTTFLDNLLANDFAKPISRPITIILTILISIIAGISTRKSKKWYHAVIISCSLIIVLIATAILAYPLKIWFSIAPLGAGMIFSLLASGVVNYAIEGHQKRFIKGAFKQYLSPIVIEKLMQDPDRLQLGGEEKTLSIFFSDIQGFTTISENLTPKELTHLLNTYLTAMTNIIHNEGGTIDKYEGDAIIAFWNAPLEQNDHAKRAVSAALRCQQKLEEMRPALKEICGKDVMVRIGINTGPVVVGNMGSDQRFDYTFLGDSGNLAARLEGINKQFGTYLMISEFTKNIIAETFPTRELSRVTVVGKTQPITIYEPFLSESYQSRKTELEQFDQALQLYYNGNFNDAEKIFAELDDPPAKIYTARCKQLSECPPDNWQGIWNITEK